MSNFSKTSFEEQLFKLSDELIGELHEKIAVKEQSLDNPSPFNALLIPESLRRFYQELSHTHIKWETREAMLNESKLFGCINLLKAEQVLSDWEGIVYFKSLPHYDWMQKFKVVDFFADEACVGFIQSENNLDYMEYLDLGENETQPLSLTFEGYYELMIAARGFLYWQRAILHIRNGGGYEVDIDRFKTYMPQIFPDFKWEEFVALYERVKIK